MEYFNEWLSGFIEGESYFGLSSRKTPSFNIAQKWDKYLIAAIIDHFEITTKLREPTPDFYSVTVYSQKNLTSIINHCTKYPLLGEKYKSYSILKKHLFSK